MEIRICCERSTSEEGITVAERVCHMMHSGTRYFNNTNTLKHALLTKWASLSLTVLTALPAIKTVSSRDGVGLAALMRCAQHIDDGCRENMGDRHLSIITERSALNLHLYLWGQLD